MQKSLREIASDLVSTPVKTPKPLKGEEAQLEAFHVLQGEVGNSGVHAKEPDWETVAALSQEYLRKVARDVRAASYLARAWSALHGAEGAVAGAQLLSMLLASGQELAPPRVRGRQAALQWWVKETSLKCVDELPDDLRSEMLAIVDQLGKALEGDPKLAGKAELFAPLRTKVEQISEGEPARQDPDADVRSDEHESGNPAVAAEEPQKEGAESAGDEPEAGPEPGDEVLAAWLTQLEAPISEANPVGDDSYHSDEFGRLRDEVNSTVRVRGVDWEQVFELSRTFLNEQSKDFRVMAYFVRAGLELEGMRGLARGLEMLDRFLQLFGENGHPDRPKARESALLWLAGQTEAWFKRNMAGYDRNELERCARAVESVNAQLSERSEVKVNRAALGSVARALRDVSERMQAEEQARSPEPASTAPASSAAALQPTPSQSTSGAASSTAAAPAKASIDSEVDFRDAIRDGNSFITGLIRFRRSSDPRHPLAYKLLRNWLWGTLADDVNPTALPSPNPRDLEALENMTTTADPRQLLERAENMLLSQRYCLDLNRYTATALGQLQAPEAIAALQTELLAFVRRFPQLLTESFSGGVPFANSATRSWIESSVLSAAGGSDMPIATATSNSEDVTEALAEARDIAGAGNPGEAIELLERGRRGANSGFERFGWQAAMTRFLLELGAAELALAHVEAMERQVLEFSLEQWDPERAIEVAWLARQVEAGISDKSSCKQRAKALKDAGEARICRLTPAVAVERFGKSRKT